MKVAIVSSVILITVIGAAAQPLDDEEPPRTADYVGFRMGGYSSDPIFELCWTYEGLVGEDCPVPQPYLVACDDSSLEGMGSIQGVGMVKFCNIVEQSEVAIKINDFLVDPVQGWIVCYQGEYYTRLAEISGSTRMDIPEWCTQHSDDIYGTTRLAVIILGPPDGLEGTKGEVTLAYERVGQ